MRIRDRNQEAEFVNDRNIEPSGNVLGELVCKHADVGALRRSLLGIKDKLVGFITQFVEQWVNQEWWAFKLKQQCKWQLSTYVAKKDQEVVLQGEERNESSFSTLSIISKGKVDIEDILSQACVISRTKGREQDAHAMTRDADTPLQQTHHTGAPVSHYVVLFDHVVSIRGCNITILTLDVSGDIYQAISCVDPRVACTWETGTGKSDFLVAYGVTSTTNTWSCILQEKHQLDIGHVLETGKGLTRVFVGVGTTGLFKCEDQSGDFYILLLRLA